LVPGELRQVAARSVNDGALGKHRPSAHSRQHGAAVFLISFCESHDEREIRRSADYVRAARTAQARRCSARLPREASASRCCFRLSYSSIERFGEVHMASVCRELLERRPELRPGSVPSMLMSKHRREVGRMLVVVAIA
jgi:hypothetical protein